MVNTLRTPIRNSEVIKQLVETGKLQQTIDKIPTEFAEKIVPTLDCNPLPIIKVANTSASDNISATIITTAIKKRTFLKGVSLTLSKDVLSQSTISTISATLKEGVNRDIVTIRYEPLIVGQFTQTIIFDIAIELKEGTIITVNNSSAVASIDTTGTIYYYEVD